MNAVSSLFSELPKYRTVVFVTKSNQKKAGYVGGSNPAQRCALDSHSMSAIRTREEIETFAAKESQIGVTGIHGSHQEAQRRRKTGRPVELDRMEEEFSVEIVREMAERKTGKKIRNMRFVIEFDFLRTRVCR
jgi:hypothetical protein